MNPLDAVNQLGHAESLGRLEDLPADYVKAINDLSVAPLWPQLRGLLPRGQPSRATQPFMWRYRTCARTCCARAS
jgi:gentisate 1,2-dioxygenase